MCYTVVITLNADSSPMIKSNSYVDGTTTLRQPDLSLLLTTEIRLAGGIFSPEEGFWQE